VLIEELPFASVVELDRQDCGARPSQMDAQAQLCD